MAYVSFLSVVGVWKNVGRIVKKRMRMTLESNVLESHITSISYKVYKKKGESRNRKAREDKQILAVCFSKKVGWVKSVFNLKKKTLIFRYSQNLLVNNCSLNDDILNHKIILAKLFRNHEINLFKFISVNSIWFTCDLPQSVKIYVRNIVWKY